MFSFFDCFENHWLSYLIHTMTITNSLKSSQSCVLLLFTLILDVFKIELISTWPHIFMFVLKNIGLSYPHYHKLIENFTKLCTTLFWIFWIPWNHKSNLLLYGVSPFWSQHVVDWEIVSVNKYRIELNTFSVIFYCIGVESFKFYLRERHQTNWRSLPTGGSGNVTVCLF